jgi:hypothetical protein
MLQFFDRFDARPDYTRCFTRTTALRCVDKISHRQRDPLCHTR